MKEEIVKMMVGMSGRYSYHTIFQDWVAVMAIAIQNNCVLWHDKIWQEREEHYKNIMSTHHMKDGTFVSWLAFDGENIVGTSGMSFVEKPPYFGCPTGKIGLLSSMFTNPDYRRKGIAKELLSRVVNDAREYGCGTVQITASDMGVKLYTDFGFVHNDNFMQYKI